MFKKNSRVQVFFIPVFILLHLLCYAQKEANIWYFGNAGLNFNGGAPVALTNSAMNSWEPCASIADANGNLLFYTNGTTVWNKNHIIMPNGAGLLGTTSSWQGALIVPKPGDCPIYYLFTTAEQGSGGAYYSEIDMNLNGGLGDIVLGKKNMPLINPCAEGLTAVHHSNGKDVWVVMHKWQSDGFYAYLLTCNGLSGPVISNIGTVHDIDNGNWNYALMNMRLSPDGKKLIKRNMFLHVGNVLGSLVELFDFNNTTGVLSNAMVFINSSAVIVRALSFSPNSQLVYFGENANAYQYNIASGVLATILASKTLVGSHGNTIWDMHLATNGKLYIQGANGQNALDVINNPNTLGAGCTYQNNTPGLAGKTTGLHLPNFVQSYFDTSYHTPPPMPFTANFGFTQLACNSTVSFTNPSTGCPVTFQWDFDDPSTGGFNTSTIAAPVHNFSGPGTYNVKLIVRNECDVDSLVKTIIVPAPLTGLLTKGTANCSGCGCTQWLIITGLGGTSPYTYSWPDGYTNRYKNQLCPGTYTINIKDKNGCNVNLSLAVP